MKRDMNLIREILLAVEKADTDPGLWIELEIPNRSQKEISYHVMLLDQAGFLSAKNLGTKDGYAWHASSLTWVGHEFLDAARNDKVWKKAVEKAKKVAGSVSIDVLTALLKETAKDLLGLGS